jgi:glycosyltransferase involved in cell wall biosynthesis
MRLTLINQFYLPDLSPTAHLCASLAKHRAALGDQVTVLTGDCGYLGPITTPPSDDSVNVRRLRTSHLGSRTKVRRLLDWATFYFSALIETTRLGPQDVIISLTTPPFIAWVAVILKWLHPNTRLILWNMDCWPDTAERLHMIQPNGFLSHIMRRLNRALFRQLDHLICLDRAMADLVLSQYAPTDRPLPTSIIPNWEDAALFPADARIEPWDDPIIAFLKDRFVILYLGNAGYGHEFQTLLDAAEQLRDTPVTFLFVGGGAHFDFLREEARTRNLNILLHDYVPKEQTPAVMQLASCALITLENYALGVMSPSKLHANLAMSLPVIYIGPESSNVDHAIRHFNCGISLRPGQSNQLTTAIRNLLNNPSLQSQLRIRARQAFDAAYCDLRTLPQFDALLDGKEH